MTNDFKMVLNVPVSKEKLYNAIHTQEGVRNWWTNFAEISEEIGGISEFNFPAAGFYVITENEELLQYEEVVWKVIESRHPEASGFEDLEDWVGTNIRFEIESLSDNECRLHFTHEGLTPQLECFNACENGWMHYLDSLKNYAVHGKGAPYTDNSENNIKRSLK